MLLDVFERRLNADGKSVDTQRDPIRVTSIDIGTANFGMVQAMLVPDFKRTGRLGQPECKVILERAAVIDIRGPRRHHASIEEMLDGLHQKLTSEEYAWVWDPSAQAILVERQVDNLHAIRSKSDERNQPINAVVFGALYMLVLALARPDKLFERCSIAGCACGEFTPLRWVTRDGKQKSGLKGVHGAERKKKVQVVGPEFLELEEQHDALAYVNLLARSKPREDVLDAYLQARHYLEAFHNRRCIDHRNEQRAKRKAIKQQAATQHATRTARQRKAGKGVTKPKRPRKLRKRKSVH